MRRTRKDDDEEEKVEVKSGSKRKAEEATPAKSKQGKLDNNPDGITKVFIGNVRATLPSIEMKIMLIHFLEVQNCYSLIINVYLLVACEHERSDCAYFANKHSLSSAESEFYERFYDCFLGAMDC